jgi:hypothetical protein
MQTDIFASLARLSDDELAAGLKSLAARERDATARMVAHLAEMETRDIHLRAGYPRLYDYCRGVLHLSEWEAWNRIEAGHLARRFPILLDMLEEGSIHITGIKLLGPHLTPANHCAVLAEARYKSKLAISEIVARLRPQPDVPTTITRVLEFAALPEAPTGPPSSPTSEGTSTPPRTPPPAGPAGPPPRPTSLTPLSPERYKLQLTISGQTLEKLRRAKDMLGHAVPASDDDAILNRALTVLIDKLGRKKFAQTDKPRPGRRRSLRARMPSAAVKRLVWKRDGGRCKYTAPDGHRCEETRRIVPHHLDPWVLAGSPDDPAAYELRCQRHNDYEGRLYFGKRRRGDGADKAHEQPARYAVDSFSAVLVLEQIASRATGGPASASSASS